MFIAVEPGFSEPLNKEFLRIKNDFLQLRQNYEKYIEQNLDITNLDNFKVILVMTNTIQKRERKIYLGITSDRKIAKNECETDQQG